MLKHRAAIFTSDCEGESDLWNFGPKKPQVDKQVLELPRLFLQSLQTQGIASGLTTQEQLTLDNGEKFHSPEASYMLKEKVNEFDEACCIKKSDDASYQLNLSTINRKTEQTIQITEIDLDTDIKESSVPVLKPLLIQRPRSIAFKEKNVIALKQWLNSKF